MIKKTLLLFIEALVINKLLYSSSVWANTSSKNLKKLQTVQNFACRIITGIKKFDHVTSGLQELNWLSIENLLIYKDTIMAYKCLNNLAPSYLANKFTKRSDIHNCQTRNNHCLIKHDIYLACFILQNELMTVFSDTSCV